MSIIIEIKNNKNLAIVKRNMLCLDGQDINKIESMSNCMNKRYFAPLHTENQTVNGLGASLVGLKQILVGFGYNAFEVTDVLDKYDKKNIVFLEKSNGKKSTFISMSVLSRVIHDIMKVLDPNNIDMVDTIVGLVYTGCVDKSDYILDKLEEVSIEDECRNIIQKYNIFEGNLYGSQQYNIRKEVCEKLGKNMAFSQCLKELDIKYKWIDEQPYINGEYGKMWLVCKLV